MALYTVFAWTAIVIAGGAYYWIYIRQAPFPTHLLGFSANTETEKSLVESITGSPSQKRKRKGPAPKRRQVTSQTNDLITGTSGVSADESETEQRQSKSTQQIQDEKVGRVENKSLKVDVEPPRKQVKHESHSTSSDADESDALDTPTPGPSKKMTTGDALDTVATKSKNAAEARFERITPKTAVDDMVPQEDRPTVARVMRISSPSQETTQTPTRPTPSSRTESSVTVDKDGLTKKQRQNLKKKERHREARAREEAIRQSQLRAHQKELETIRLNSQIKAAEKKSTQPNPWQQSGGPSAMDDSVYTVRNLSEENLTTVGHPSDGAGSEEGWQEVTSRAAKKAASAASQKSSEKLGSGTEGSDISSMVDSEEGSITKARPAYATGNSFANLDS